MTLARMMFGPFVLMSLKPGIGVPWFTDKRIKFVQSLSIPVLRLRSGFKFTIPRFFRLKYFTAEQLNECKNYQIENAFRWWTDDYSARSYSLYQKDLEDFDKRKSEQLKRRFIFTKI